MINCNSYIAKCNSKKIFLINMTFIVMIDSNFFVTGFVFRDILYYDSHWAMIIKILLTIKYTVKNICKMTIILFN